MGAKAVSVLVASTTFAVLLAGCPKRTTCRYQVPTHRAYPASSAQALDAARKQWISEPPRRRHGWWHVMILLSDCTMNIVEVCQESVDSATSSARQRLYVLRGALDVNDVGILGMSPDENCKPGDIASEEY